MCTAAACYPTPHHVAQRKDQDPEEVDRVPVRCTRLDDLLISLPAGQLVDEDAEGDEAGQQVDDVDRGEEEEVVVGERVPRWI
jgi:hypothetical protein